MFSSITVIILKKRLTWLVTEPNLLYWLKKTALFVAAQSGEQWFARRSSIKASNGIKDFRNFAWKSASGPSQTGPANVSRIMIRRRTYVIA
jgi:hypothetical protein